MECRCSFKALRVILLHFKVDKMNRGVIKKNFKKKYLFFFFEWGTTMENPGNHWKNPDFQVFPENSHP
jgi:hypothetical protein